MGFQLEATPKAEPALAHPSPREAHPSHHPGQGREREGLREWIGPPRRSGRCFENTAAGLDAPSAKLAPSWRQGQGLNTSRGPLGKLRFRWMALEEPVLSCFSDLQS